MKPLILVRVQACEPSSIIIVMERDEIERQADAICNMYDEVYFNVMNRVLDEVRDETNNSHKATPNNLARVALRALGSPKIQ